MVGQNATKEAENYLKTTRRNRKCRTEEYFKNQYDSIVQNDLE